MSDFVESIEHVSIITPTISIINTERFNLYHNHHQYHLFSRIFCYEEIQPGFLRSSASLRDLGKFYVRRNVKFVERTCADNNFIGKDKL